MRLNIIDRVSNKLKEVYISHEWSINVDRIEGENSSFIVSGDMSMLNVGDYIVANAIDDDFIKSKEIYFSFYEMNIIRPTFFGIITNFEDDSIECTDHYAFFNSEVIDDHFYKKVNAIYMKNMAEMHMIKETQVADAYNLAVEMPHVLSTRKFELKDDSTDKERGNVQSVNLMDFFHYWFKYQRLNWRFCGYYLTENNEFRIVMALQDADYEYDEPDPEIYDLGLYDVLYNYAENILQFKDNSFSFVNWEYYNEGISYDTENELYIKDVGGNKTGTYYLNNNNEVQQESMINVHLPTRRKTYIWNSAEESDKTMNEIALDELGGNEFSHTIEFDVLKKTSFINMDMLETGARATILYKGTVYKTVLTGWSHSSDSEYIHLVFGNIRSTFKRVIKRWK